MIIEIQGSDAAQATEDLLALGLKGTYEIPNEVVRDGGLATIATVVGITLSTITIAEKLKKWTDERKPRYLPADHCFPITVRCNNREFRLNRLECRAVLLDTIHQAQTKFNFKLACLG